MALFDEDDIINDDLPSKPSVDVHYEDYEDVSTNLSKDLDTEFITAMEGTPWYIDSYFSAILASDSEIQPYDSSISPIYQQYRRIRDMELKIPPGSSLEPTFNEENKATLSGEALVYPGLRPNKMDCFLARIADNRLGLFTVVEVQELSYLKNVATRIRFEILTHPDTNIINDLEAKTAQVYYFKTEYLNMGRNPLITEKDYGLSEDLEQAMHAIAKTWYSSFSKAGFQSVGLPKQPVATFDPFLLRALKMAIDDRFDRRISEIVNVTIKGTEGDRVTTVLDALVNPKDYKYMPTATQMVRVDRRQMPYSHDFGSAATTAYQEFIYPSSAHVDDIVHFVGNWTSLTSPLSTDSLTPPEEMPLFGDMFEDEYYVFSKSFYEEKVAKSTLESLVLKRLENEPIDSAILLELCEGWQSLNSIHRFYYGPILLLLLLYKFRSF